VLNCYPDINCSLEPFIPEHLDERYGSISNADTLGCALAEIWRGYNGIKHVWYRTGWPFDEGLAALNHELLRCKKTKIIFLTRRNELRRIVSGEMSWQTGVWGEFTEMEREQVRRFDYKPLTPENIQLQLRFVTMEVAELRKTLREANATFLDLQYEDLFADAVYLTERLKILGGLRDFIGAPKDYHGQVDFAVADLLNPTKSKLNLMETYQRIPNIEEIERRFGSDESGWLFKETQDRIA
jgi:hypothetical protein